MLMVKILLRERRCPFVLRSVLTFNLSSHIKVSALISLFPVLPELGRLTTLDFTLLL